MDLFKRLPFHPLFFAVYPVLALLAYNLGQVPLATAARSLVIALLVGGAFVAACAFLPRGGRKAALVASLVLVLFFSYGHLYDVLRGGKGVFLLLGKHSLLGPLYILVLVVGIWFILKSKSKLLDLTLLLNVTGGLLVLFSLAQVGTHYAKLQSLSAPKSRARAAQHSDLPGLPANPPDIYYIILDSYSRQDILQSKFDYTNADFLDGLRKLGFYVADCGHSNYEYTEYSLSSSLNMDYIQKFGSDFRSNGKDWLLLEKLIKDSAVRRDLEGLGYRSITMATGFQWAEWYDAAYFLTPNQETLASQAISPFEALLLRSTLLRILTDTKSVQRALGLALGPVNFPYEFEARVEYYALSQLDNILSYPSPKFVYAHLMTTHDPIMFDEHGNILSDPAYYPPSGETISPEYFVKGAVGEYKYANARILKIVQNIIQNSKRPVIIVIQGDHGRVQPRTPILNAYYLPGGAKDLYPTISPVNTFRVIFNRYFGASYPLLPDVSYHIDSEIPGRFTEVPEPNPACVK